MSLPTEPTSKRQLPGITPGARLMDRTGQWIITAGGIGVILSVLGIFLFVLMESYPLFLKPSASRAHTFDFSHRQPVLCTGVDPYQAVMFVVHEAGIDFVDMTTKSVTKSVSIPELQGRRIRAAYRALDNTHVGLGLDDGTMLGCRVNFAVDYDAEGKQIVTPSFSVESSMDLTDEALVHLVFRHDGKSRGTVLGIADSGQLVLGISERQRGLLGDGKTTVRTYDLTDEIKGRARVGAVAKSGRYVLVGTDRGEVFRWEIGRASSNPRLLDYFRVSDQEVSALDFVLGDVSLVVGDVGGRVSVWMPVRTSEGDNKRVFKRIHTLQSHPAAVTALASSARDKQFLSGDVSGMVALHHMTSEQTFFQLPGDRPIQSLSFAPKANGFLTVSKSGQVTDFGLYNPHPEVTLQTLFGKVWYEGYTEPQYVWQSTGGSDDFEPKLSIVPLIFGTFKGTLYAMLFALPLAVLAAIYTSEFASPNVRGVVKPVVELMASLPSVILGFLAGLWLAPLLETRIVGALLLLPCVPIVVVICAWGWGQMSEDFARRIPDHWILTLLAGIALFSLYLSFALGPLAESLLFGGNFQSWLLGTTGTRYDQRNCLVVGFAMGFAVVPIIYTICEDALSSVPQHLRAGSLALGATPWQTAIRVVLPTASPGIFSATMIGFGRAVGETMIVLMATGNTPILDWTIFNGMRTMSANIAVEIPEAPHEGTLYRVLFLTGVLLAAITFLVNTLAEVVRQRLREKYSRI
ncbi:MAG: ABC transporter permease subunit [Gemmatimonadetes bacterium]|nr:ABC transporter permease subunit [Gemmatimonadota bacterium]